MFSESRDEESFAESRESNDESLVLWDRYPLYDISDSRFPEKVVLHDKEVVILAGRAICLSKWPEIRHFDCTVCVAQDYTSLIMCRPPCELTSFVLLAGDDLQYGNRLSIAFMLILM